MKYALTLLCEMFDQASHTTINSDNEDFAAQKQFVHSDQNVTSI